MCVFNRPRPTPPPPPRPAPAPAPRPTPPPPEPTADRVAVGQQRVRSQSHPRVTGQQTTTSQRRRSRQSIRTRRRLGTASLRIPLLSSEQTGTGNLRY